MHQLGRVHTWCVRSGARGAAPRLSCGSLMDVRVAGRHWFVGACEVWAGL
jgi:hypothetical protein